MTLEELEARIEHEYQQLVASSTNECRRFHFEEMKSLILQRTIETVARMERERGLRAP